MSFGPAFGPRYAGYNGGDIIPARVGISGITIIRRTLSGITIVPGVEP